MHYFRPILCSTALLAALAGCVQPPLGPRVAVMPAPNKPFEVFAAEDNSCRQYASQQVAGGAEQANNQEVGSAVVGTVLGAALGA
ncbi:MAG: glycine zipper family protein, partial [Aliidongia sp.]